MNEILGIVLSLLFSVVNSSPAIVSVGPGEMPSPKINSKVIEMPDAKIKDRSVKMPEPRISRESEISSDAVSNVHSDNLV